MITERRKTPRARCLFGGFIAYSGGRASIDCQVRNLSATGAMLAFAIDTMVPARFTLQVAQLGAPVQARVLWRAGQRCGVGFDAADPVVARAPGDLAGRIAAYRPTRPSLRVSA